MATELQTRSITQLLRSVAVPAGAFVPLQVEGAPAVGVPVEALFGRYLSVDVVYETAAELAADLAHAANSIGLVYGDPDPTNSIYWVKQGASGVGSWIKTNIAAGQTGVTGPANSTYATTADLEAADVANVSAILAESAKAGTFTIRDYADFTAEVAADTSKVNYIRSTATPAKVWVRTTILPTTGAPRVGAKSDGTGAVDKNVAQFLWHHAIHLEDYFTGTLTHGADITSALQAAITAAFTRRSAIGGVGKVIIPAGYYYQLSATVTIPACVIVEGAGKVETYLRRTGNYGDTFVVGTANPAANVQCAGIRKMAIFHDHGGGTVPLLNPASWVNPVTGTPSHIVTYTPVGCIFEDLNLYCLPFQFVCQGGAQSVFRNIDTYGVWDDDNAAMQEGLAGFLMAGDAAVTGSIPTWHKIDFCRFGGMTRPGVTVNYYGNSKTTVKNIGSQNGLVIWMAEALYISNSYTGACNSNGILLSSKSTDIIAGVFITDHFFDPCGVKYQDACLRFENRDAGGIIDSVTLTNPQFKGQQNGWRAISDWGNTATYGSVKELIVKGGHASVFVGNPIELYNVRRARIDMNISAYNCENWYSADQACAIHVAAGVSVLLVDGILGGGTYGETAAGANNRCVDGVRCANSAASRVTVRAIDGGLSGALLVG